MTCKTVEDFRVALGRLHYAKTVVYRDAWKRRGEVISIMANIARKVDRLEYIADGSPTTTDESVFDTAADLLVYSLKYLTFLADHDDDVAAMLFTDLERPYSDGTHGFDSLLAGLDLMAFNEPHNSSWHNAISGILSAFSELEACFQGNVTYTPAIVRARHGQALVAATVTLLAVLREGMPAAYDIYMSAVTKLDAT